MKVCECCGAEISTKDGEGLCASCDASAMEGKRVKNAKRSAARKARESVLRSCGLTKVRGAMGGTYWE